MVRMHRARRLTIVAGCFVIVGGVAFAQQPAPEQVTAPFSDPSRPGTLRVALINGSMTIHGENRRDVAIEAQAGGRARDRQTPDGLRRITPVGGFQVSEERNEMTIRAQSPNEAVAFDIKVPRQTVLRVRTVNGGAITIDGVEGEVEADNTNGSISLTNVGGPVVANTLNGKILAVFARIPSDKPMAFTSLNGGLDVTLPPSTKANLKLQSDRGDIYTDFDIQLRAAAAPKPEQNQRGGGRLQIEVKRAVTGAINGGGPEFELRTLNGNVYLRKAK
jgi:hypothetical protein